MSTSNGGPVPGRGGRQGAPAGEETGRQLDWRLSCHWLVGSVGLPSPQSPGTNSFSTYQVPPRFYPPARKGGRSCTLLDGPPTAEGFPALDPPSACCWRPA